MVRLLAVTLGSVTGYLPVMVTGPSNTKRQMYHDTIAAILSPIKTAMTRPVVRRCPDGHFRRVIYDLAAYIADYPEQVYLAGIVQNWCPKYELFILLK